MKPLAIDLLPLPHRLDYPAEYNAWSGMKTRCYNPQFKDWHLYGGKGITVCGRWKLAFHYFFEDVGPRPSSLHSLDRFPNPDGNYEPGNVRWATRKEQARNWSSRNRRFALGSESLTLPEWAERLGMSRESLRDRIESGWSLELALSTPPIRDRKREEDGTFAKAIVY